MASKASKFAQMLASRPVLPSMPAHQVRIITSMRAAILAHGMGQDIKPYLVKQLCSEDAAKCFAHMMEKMGDCWPEPVTVRRPCCAAITYDEMLLIDMITSVAKCDTGYFHSLLSDMIDAKSREKLHNSISKFINSYQ